MNKRPGMKRLGSLFSGYGGLDLAAEEVFGAVTVWHCDPDPAASAGWVTNTPGLSRNDQLRLLGNGVVPQQAIAALGLLAPATVGTQKPAA